MTDATAPPRVALAAWPPGRRRLATTISACLGLIVVAAACDATMDALSFRYDRSIAAAWGLDPQWFDPRVSWRNKWRHGDPAAGEAFPLSSTALVALTDAWHAAKAIGLAAAALALLAPWGLVVRLRWWGWVGAFLLLGAIRGVVFESLFAHALVAPTVSTSPSADSIPFRAPPAPES